MILALCLLAAAGAALVVSVCIAARRQRMKIRDRAWLPQELKTASLEFAERTFYTKWPLRQPRPAPGIR